MLKLKNIVKNYYIGSTKIPALKGVSLNFEKSEFVAVLGPSGCGKTTLLNIIGGLDRYTSGDLVINGKTTKTFKDKDWDAYRNHSIGFVFQSYNLIMHLSVLQNVELALTLSGVSPAARRERAKEVLERVGLGDQISKKPSQLSGGQMQRVAIARALVNNPDILLTDEPTGALDSATSEQIMQLITEISAERLVIMVTHNPDIAKRYSTRIIKLLDGQVISDEKNQPEQEVKKVAKENFDSQSAAPATKAPAVNKKAKTSMSFFTALSLSFKNLFTKKVRTIITSIAGSIGIIGIALVLSLSNGFNNFIGKMQSDTMSNYPLIIQAEAMDYSAFMRQPNTKSKLRPNTEKIYPQSLMNLLMKSQVKNNITEDYINYVEKTDKSLINAVTYDYGINYAKYFYADYTETGFVSIEKLIDTKLAFLKGSNMGGSMFSLQQLPQNSQFLLSQYDLIKGELPENSNEMVLILDEYNRISDISLVVLGLLPESALAGQTENMELSFDSVFEKEYYIFSNNDIFEKDAISNIFSVKASPDKSKGEKIKISGILRLKEGTTMGALSSGIAANQSLTEKLIDKNFGRNGFETSEIVSFMLGNNQDYPLGGKYTDLKLDHKEELRKLGGITVANEIRIYPKDFKAKDSVKTYLDKYNDNIEKEEDKIKYVDNIETMLSSMTMMVDAISYVLIAFTAISLVVSSVMIGIITYVSVIERTKEIGILRSIGARKKDISRVFNAETFIIGLTSGILGVAVGGLLNIPINLILGGLVDGIGNLAVLNLLHAGALVLISVGLTFIAGLIPSRIAAKKDPVVALRNE